MVTNIKKIALSLLVACLAIGFSAFTNAGNSNDDPQPYTFYNTGASVNVDKSTYQYDPNGSCENPESGNCSITILLQNEPAPNANPTGDLSGVVIVPGFYVAGN